MPLKICNYPRCNNLTKKSYCDKHNNYTYYNNKRSNDKEMKFYRTKEWRDKRSEALKRDCYVCQRCGADATVVHHIVEVRQDYNKRLDIDNLESVCSSCHNKIHKR